MPRASRRASIGRLIRLAASGAIAAGLLWPATQIRAAGSITGVVFQDFNANGTQDTSATIPNNGAGTIGVAIDAGVAGVTVTAFDSAGTAQGTTTTAADGTYTLNATGTGPYRIEFTALPAGLFPGRHGPTHGTTVTFVPDGNSTGVNLGLVAPQDYCQDNPLLATPCYQFGPQVGNGAPVLVSFPYSAGATPPQAPATPNAYDNPNTHAIAVPASLIGSTYGVTFQRTTGNLFAGAYMKRHVAFGPLGVDSTGAIYRIDSGGVASLFLDLNALFGAGTAGVNPHPVPGTVDFLHDTNAFDPVGKVSLGDIDISEDQNTLFAVNLANRELYEIPIGSPPTAPPAASIEHTSMPIALPGATQGCNAADVRPLGLGVHNGLVYAGLVCSAQTSGLTTDLRAYIYSFDPGGNTFSAAPVLEFPLDYPRGSVSGGPIPAEWLPWISTFPAVFPRSIHPQPIVSNIVFDRGTMIVGLRDRYGDQAGENTFPTDPADTTFISARVAGDFLRACPAPGGTFTLESNAACDGQGPTAGANNAQGPGNGEFYFQENYGVLGDHDETALGTMTQVPGFPHLAGAHFDPAIYPTSDSDGFFDGGFRWHNNTDGTAAKAYRIFSIVSQGDPPTTFGKANGLGDVEAFCALAPIEVGNRLWIDANGNGLQDAGEAPLAGVSVQLIAPDMITVLATATTNAAGEYFFSNGPGTTTGNSIYNVAGLTPNTAGLKIRIATAQGPLTGLILATPNAGGDTIDSDATLVGPNAEIMFTTSGPGVSDHTFDVGFVPPTAPVITGFVFVDADTNGTRGPTESGVPGVTVTAFDATNTPVGTTTTAPNGSYIISVSAPGPYRVEFTNVPAPYQPGPLGPDNGSTIQYVPAAPATNISLGLIDPITACANPFVAVPCYLSGDVFAPGSPQATGDVLISLPYGSQGLFPAVNHDVKAPQVGSVWGLAWQRTTRKLFSGAFLKRHVVLGPLGLGGIYVSDYAAGFGPAPTTTPFLDLAALGVNVGTIVNPRGLPANGSLPSLDSEVFDLVGKAGLGDLDLSDDGNTLYAINLFERTIVRIDITAYNAGGPPPTAAQVTSIAVPDPTPACVNGVARPFGLKFWHGDLYVGVTCTAEDPSGVRADLRGLVYRTDPAGASFTTVLDFPIDYTDGGAAAGGCRQFEPWTALPLFTPVAFNNCRRSPVVSDIEFDLDGSMVIGVMDRSGHQWGFQNFRPDAPVIVFNWAVGGDLLRAHNNAGTFALENAGTTAAGGGCGLTPVDGGIGGGEYYCGDRFGFHRETSMGAAAFLAGTGEMVVPVMDPFQINSGGLRWFNNTTGEGPTTGTDPRGAELYNGGMAATFGKTNGLGDVEIICDPLPIEVGNFIWIDQNGNGVQDPGEPPVSGLTVQLIAPDGTTVLGMAITDANGKYSFSNGPGTNTPNMIYDIAGLTPNTPGFTIKVDLTQPAATGRSVTSADANPNDQIDSDATLMGGTMAIIPVTTGPAGANHTFDIGLIGLSLGNLVWIDANNNGIVDVGEPGIPNVTLNLYQDANTDCAPDGGILATTMTDANGRYLFADLQTGSYVVEAATPTGFVSSTGTAGSATGPVEPAPAPDTDLNNDDNGTVSSPTAVRSCTVTLAPAAEPTNDEDTSANTNLTVDFGFFQPLSLGNTVWQDTNNNCLHDGSETGIPNVPVSLLDGTGTTVLSTTTTDATGTYLFGFLPPGDFVVAVTPPSGFRSSTGTNGSPTGACEPAPDPDNDVNATDDGTTAGTEVRSGPVTLMLNGEPTNDGDSSPMSNLSVDFALVQPLSLGNMTFADNDNDGVMDPGEPGLPGMTINLLDATGTTTIATTTTDANGKYLFTLLAPGDYIVEAVPPPGYATSTGTPGSPTGPFEPSPDPDNDVDNDDNGTTTTPTTVRSIPISLAPGTEPTNDGDTDPNTNLTVDFGLVPQLRLGNLVWSDANNNGIVDPGEPGVSGVTVNLYTDPNADCAPDGAALRTTTTDANGNYLFTALPAGGYVVEIVLPAGFVTSTGTPGATGPYEPAPSPDNDVNNDDNGTASSPTIVRSCTITLVANAEPLNDGDADPTTDANSNLTVDFGIFRPVALGNLVWLDDNNNGVRDPGEPGQDGIPVTLYRDSNGDGVPEGTAVASTTTSGGGLYSFPGLSPDTYVVVIIGPPGCVTSTGANGQAAGPYEIAPDPDNDIDNDDNGSALGSIITSAPIVLVGGTEPTNDGDTSADSNLSVDFGLFKPAALGDLVWLDSNTNGLQDPGEPGVPDVTVTLHAGNGSVVATTTTDPAGSYRFENLVPGDYFVTFTPPPGLSLAPRDAGGDDTRDSDADPITGEAPITTLTPLEDDPTWDAGLVPRPTLCLGNLVWNDANTNGRVDDNEEGVSGVPVELYADANADGVPDGPALASTMTIADGTYKFCALPEGKYVVQVPPHAFAAGGALNGFINSSANGVPAPSPDTDLDNDDNGDPLGGLVTSGTVMLNPNAEPTTDGDSDPNTNLTVDFGFYRPNVPVIGLTYQAGPPQPNPDGSYDVPLTLNVRNLGSVDLVNVQITDDLQSAFPLPATFNVVPGTLTTTGGLVPNGAFNGTTDPNLLVGTGILPVNGEGVVRFVLRLFPNGYFGPFVTSAIATADGTSDVSNDNVDPDANGNSIPNEAPDNVPVALLLAAPGQTDVVMTMGSFGDPSRAGNVFDFFLNVTNHGETPTDTPLTLVFNLPPSVRRVAAPGMDPFGTGWRCAGPERTVVCTFEGALRPAQETSVTVWTEIVQPVSPLTGTSSVFYASDGDPSNNTAVHSIPPAPGGPQADLAVDATGTGIAQPGETIEAHVTLVNRGSVPATDVVLTTVLSSSVRFDVMTSSLGACARATPETYECAVGTLGVGQTVTFLLRTVAQTPDTVLQTFQARSAGTPDPAPANNAAVVTTIIPGVPAESIDTDRDGMSDTWERRFGLNPLVADAGADPDSDGLSNIEELRRGGHPRGFHKQLFAEGVVNNFFLTELAMLNPSPVHDANVLVTLMRDGGRTTQRYQHIGTMGRWATEASVILGAEPGTFSTLIESDVPLAADRGMQWDIMGRYGSSAETAISTAATQWFLAEGATHGFALFYLLENPDPAAAANVKITYLTPSGVPLAKTYTLAPHSRTTIWVNEIAELENQDVSAQIESTNGVPIVVERAMYRDGNGQIFAAGHAGAGATSLSREWFFAEGATGTFFDTFVLIANPGATAADVTLRFQLPDGSTFTKDYRIDPTSRRTLSIENEDPRLAETTMAITVTSSQPIAAERAMWWPGPAISPQWYEAHATLGATTTGTKWAVAGGSAGGAFEDATFILVANQAAQAGTAKVTVVFDDRSMLEKTIVLPGTSRTTLDVAAEFPEARGRAFSTIVESVGDAPVPLVVECARYASPGTLWGAGASALATKLQ